ncbi:MAG: fibronectin type III domain-containing protein [Chloroflexi bacterium]|nr:fibronectin type III domain-containing protein [Chloroflexota bacterium]
MSRRPQLWWDEVEGATRYAVLLGTEGALQGFLADGPPFVPAGNLQAGTAYEWLVYALTGYGWGPYSETWTFHTEPTISD